uniref:Uncharacterized protein n=1 Tax=uncultured bacterium 66 TaxID=698391 RepID=E3T678_9BACT|nr:hypothetical protein [uncultured bacterium 66]
MVRAGSLGHLLTSVLEVGFDEMLLATAPDADKPIEQILTKGSGADARFEVTIGGRD